MRRKTTLPVDGYTGRARRAREEPMAVRPLRDGRYVV
ncbi:SWIM zinc finger family protein, partial [Halogeometricum sp. CBA1124]|nr:SWIM zinc finger family protein [Halogeometricum sp. CBA1124]